jgi:hypothetical protein
VVSVTAPNYVPFEPTTDVQLATRVQLRALLAGLSAGAGEILFARFAGRLPARADVENALFYNLDGRGVFAVMAGGVSFELDPQPPKSGVAYEYATGPKEFAFRHWQPGRVLANLDATLGSGPLKLARVWWGFRSAPRSIHAAGAPCAASEAFSIALDVQGPVRGLTVGRLKTILDGAICALQSETDVARATAVAPLIASNVGAPADAVLDALLDSRPSARLPSRLRS